MFSNLASYLGYSSSPAEPSQTSNATDVRLRAVEEDDWILVERNELGGSMSTTSVGEEVEDETGITRVSLALSTCPSILPGSSKGLTRSNSLDIPCPLQESWYLTPPPSFTSEGPVHMETSPLENLLIEHPSMSVYQHTQRARKSSNSSPQSSSNSEEEPGLTPSSPTRLPRKEKLNKLPRNKLNTKFSKKLSSKRPPGSSSDDGVSAIDEQIAESKEPKMKSFVKSPRRSINSELKNLSKKSPRKRFDTSSSDEMISIPSATEDDDNTMTSQPEQTNSETVQTKKLYSEVLASKPPKVAEVKKEPSPLEKKETVPVPAPVHPPIPAESESAMSVEEPADETNERSDMERDRRRAVQTISDQQHRQHFLNRSAQKMEQRKTCDLIKRNPLLRTNKAREMNFRNKRQRRADMMQRHSGANNNRKC